MGWKASPHGGLGAPPATLLAGFCAGMLWVGAAGAGDPSAPVTPPGADRVPWYDLARLAPTGRDGAPGQEDAGEIPAGWPAGASAGGNLLESLARARDRTCGPPRRADLPVPVPADAELVFMACHGGPYPCPGRPSGAADADAAAGLSERAPGLGCPTDPDARVLATLALVSRQPPGSAAADLAQALGGDFVRLESGPGGEVVLLQKPDSRQAFAWSPKHLHVRVTPARGAFERDGYRSWLRISLSIGPLHGRSYRSICDAPAGLYGGDDAQRRGSRADPDRRWSQPSFCDQPWPGDTRRSTGREDRRRP